MTNESQSQMTDELAIERLRRGIQSKAKDAGNICFSDHATKNMEEREITPANVAKVLRVGQFTESVVINEVAKEYRFKMAGTVAGDEICVVGVVRTNSAGRIYVITAMHLEDDQMENWHDQQTITGVAD